MDLENLLASLEIGQRNDDLAVETTGPQQRRIEHVRAVGRGNQDDAFVAFETVHFDQQLVQCLFAFVVDRRPDRHRGGGRQRRFHQ